MMYKDIGLHEMVELALQEDLPSGDLTTNNLQIRHRTGRAVLKAKQDLILSGQELFTETIKQLDQDAQLTWFFRDGQSMISGQNACTIEGNLVQVLKAERVALNFLGPLSGIATLTRKFVEQIHGTKTKILDTRKTLPLYRSWAKKAVRDGGGMNHRMNLSDAIMLKDNHIALMGGLENAVHSLRSLTGLPITLEVKNLEEAKAAIQLNKQMPVQRLLLDNMTNETMSEIVKSIAPDMETEASGNMSLERVRSVAEIGVQYISVGALTHSAPGADFSLLFDWL